MYIHSYEVKHLNIGNENDSFYNKINRERVESMFEHMFVVEEGCADHDNENETNRIMLIKINTARSCNIEKTKVFTNRISELWMESLTIDRDIQKES